MTRHEAMFNWIGSYPNIHDIFNVDFSEAEVRTNSFKILDEQVKKTDILGNETVNYKFSIGEYRNYTTNPFTMENLKNIEAVDEFIDWVNEQDKIRNYPQIPNANVEKVTASRIGSGMASVDPIMRLAQYTFTVTVTYTTKEM